MRTMNEKRFWRVIEEVWTDVHAFGVDDSLRGNILGRRTALSLGAAMKPFISSFNAELTQCLAKAEFEAFAEIWDQMVFALDREVLADHLGLGDDGFGDARHLIVAMGKVHFEAVMKDPGAALVGGECERLGYIVDEVYEERFGRERPLSGWNTSTGSNLAGWPGKRARIEADTRATVAADDLWAQFGFGGNEPSVSGMVTIGGMSKAELEGAILRVAARIKQRRTGTAG